MKNLLSLDIIKITGKQLVELRTKWEKDLVEYQILTPEEKHNRYFELNFLPKKIILNTEGKILGFNILDDFLHTIQPTDQIYYCFDYSNADGIFGFEMEQSGDLECYIDTINLKEIFDKIEHISYYDEETTWAINQIHFIVTMQYSKGSYFEPYDVDIDVEFIGYLDENYIFCEL